MFNKFLIISFSALVLAGCVSAAEPVLTDSQFVMLYVDLSFAAETFLSDSVKLASVQDSVFHDHKVTRVQFFEYKNQLDESPERWSEIWEMIALELTKRESAIKTSNKVAEPKKSKSEKK